MTCVRCATEGHLTRVGQATLPTEHGTFAVHAYAGAGPGQHLTLILGDPRPGTPVLVRLHSSCVTGDVFASLRCDCGQQLEEATRRIASAGTGVIVYLDQEGRGIGLANKIRAYELQDAGRDTVDANIALGFAADQRDYAPAAHILQDLNVTHVRLMTNNPRKTEALRMPGVIVDQEPIAVAANPHNHRYLATKARRLGHHLSVTDQRDAAIGLE